MNQHEILIRKYNFLILKKHKKINYFFRKAQKNGFWVWNPKFWVLRVWVLGLKPKTLCFKGLRFEFGSETQMHNLNPFFLGVNVWLRLRVRFLFRSSNRLEEWLFGRQVWALQLVSWWSWCLISNGNFWMVQLAEAEVKNNFNQY